MERVVITGAGAVTPIGNNSESFWENLVAGKCGIDLITHFNTDEFKVKLAAEVRDFNPEDFIDKKDAKRMNRFSHLGIAAATEAMKDFKADDFNPYRAGVIVGSGIGGITVLEDEHTKLIERGPSRVSPLCIPAMIINMAAAHISMKFGFKGVSFAPVTACASATHAIGESFRMIKHGYLDVALCGGTEAGITATSIAGFSNMHAVSSSTDKKRASIPFDKERNGFVMGEGAGILLIESLSHARARGANIIAEIVGYGATSDAFHITSPDPEGSGAAMAMTMAINEAGLKPSDISYINAHGTSTPLNDKYETIAIKKALGVYAKSVSISSTKSSVGHMLGAAGGVEAVALALSVRDNIIPPTLGLLVPDEECDLDYTPITAKNRIINYAMSNSLGFGGHNASILIGKVV